MLLSTVSYKKQDYNKKKTQQLIVVWLTTKSDKKPTFLPISRKQQTNVNLNHISYQRI